MNFYHKLLTTFLVGLSISSLTFKPNKVLSQPLEQSEIRELARSITVKIVDAHTSSNGSGVLFNRKKNVYSVLTNQHVVGSDSNYEIHTPDGRKHQITFKEEIPGLDLMVVQFKSDNNYEIAEMGNSEEIAPLELVYVAGFPAIQADLDIVDGKIRSIRQDVLQNPQQKKGYALVYTNETLPGSSGGAILNEQGYLVGINGEAERDIRSGRDISRGIPINLFISLSFNYLPETQLETEEIEESEPEESEEIEKSEPEETEEIEEPAIAYVPTVATGNSNYSLAHNIVPNQEEEDHNIRSVSITPNGQTIVTGGEDGQIQVWNGLSGQLEKTIAAQEDGIQTVVVSADGDTIISGGEDSQIKIWNRRSGQLERTLEGHEGEINSVALSANGAIIASAGGDSRVNVWNRATGKLERSLEGHEEAVKSVAISADGNTIVSGGQDKQVKIWRWRTGELKNTTQSHAEEVRSVAISYDGNIIVSGSGDHSIKIWDAQGNLQHTLQGHTSKVDSVTISSDGRSIVSGSRDRSIKIWSLSTQALEQNLTTTDSADITSIAASANNQVLVSAGNGASLAIWHLK